MSVLKATRKTVYMDGFPVVLAAMIFGAAVTVRAAVTAGTAMTARAAVILGAAVLGAAVMSGTAPVFAAPIAADADKELAAGHFQAACELYRLALTTHRSDATILINASRAYEGAGNLDEAIRRAREAAVFEPANADAHLALAHCLDADRQEKAAILQFEVVVDIKNADASTRKAAYGPLLRLLKHETNWEILIKTARRGAHDFPQDPDCHFNLGWALSQVPGVCNSQSPNVPNSLPRNMTAKDVIKLQHEAVSAYQKSVELGEKRAAVHLNLAMLLADQGDTTAASAELATYLKLAPSEASRSEVKALNDKIGRKI